MKLFSGLGAIAAVFGLAACSAGNALPKEEVAKVLPAALCAKMVECAPAGGPTKADCEAKVALQVKEGKDGKPFPTVTKQQLDTCVASLGKWTCDQMMQAGGTPPTGCEFMAKK